MLKILACLKSNGLSKLKLKAVFETEVKMAFIFLLTFEEPLKLIIKKFLVLK